MLQTKTVRVGSDVLIGSGHPIVVQTMCNTHTSDIEATVAQCRRLAAAGSQLIRITVPSMKDVPCLEEISRRLRAEGIGTPLVADIHVNSSGSSLKSARSTEGPSVSALTTALLESTS